MRLRNGSRKRAFDDVFKVLNVIFIIRDVHPHFRFNERGAGLRGRWRRSAPQQMGIEGDCDQEPSRSSTNAKKKKRLMVLFVAPTEPGSLHAMPTTKRAHQDNIGWLLRAPPSLRAKEAGGGERWQCHIQPDRPERMRYRRRPHPSYQNNVMPICIIAPLPTTTPRNESYAIRLFALVAMEQRENSSRPTFCC